MAERPPSRPMAVWGEDEDCPPSRPMEAWVEDGDRHPSFSRRTWVQEEDEPPGHPIGAWVDEWEEPLGFSMRAWVEEEAGPPSCPTAAWIEEEDGCLGLSMRAWVQEEVQSPGHPIGACVEEWDEPHCFSMRAWVKEEDGAPSCSVEAWEEADQTDVVLIAIKGMKNMSALDTAAATHMLEDMMGYCAAKPEHHAGANLYPFQLQLTVAHIYENLPRLQEAEAQDILKTFLLLLTCHYPSEVVTGLLSCSPTCDSVAVAMWEVMVSQSFVAEKVLQELLCVLQDRPLCKPGTTMQDLTCLLPLTATRALNVILLQHACKQEVKALFPRLFLALLFQMSFSLIHAQEDIPAFSHEGKLMPPRPVRMVVQAVQALLCCTGYREQVTGIQQRGGWEMISRPETHLTGVALLARQMQGNPLAERAKIFLNLSLALRHKDKCQEIPSMAFLIELLRCPDLCVLADEVALNLCQERLGNERQVMRWLALRGLLTLSERPSTARKMQKVIPDVVQRLQDADGEMDAKALAVLRNVLHHVNPRQTSRLAVQLAHDLLSLFPNEVSTVRELAMRLFGELLGRAVGGERQRMKQLARQGLLPLFFHLSDPHLGAAQAAQAALVEAAKLLRWKQLRKLAKTLQTWRIGECLLQEAGPVASEYVSCSCRYLEDPRAPLREQAVRFIGLAGQLLDWREEKLEEMCSLLQRLDNDSSPTVRCLGISTIFILQAPRKASPSGFTIRALCARLRRAWQWWHPGPGAGVD
ncbi:maestro heat-like repeat-containing protein family member 7 [Struthio camelus]|uniref:maestro heat-like repeat-containing protein family member 7 n=1 Tax=Struthio camelus TaxID=8801 RepID=UPI003603B03B